MGQVRIGLVGYGEICSALGAGLRERGLESVSCYDSNAVNGPYSGLIQDRAANAGVDLVNSREELAEKSDVIISATPGSASVASARAFQACLNSGHVFVDIASAIPVLKKEVSSLLSVSGASFADGSILGTPKDGVAMKILASGPAAQRFRDLLTPWGMSIDVVGDKVGDASGIKILRSVVTKGLEALMLECMIAASRYGIADVVLGSLEKQMAKPIRDLTAGMLSTGAIHAQRRSEEALMAAEALASVGLDSVMMRATAERLKWEADLGTKEYFKGEAPKGYPAVIAGIEELLVGDIGKLRTV